jgi:hypothetical protein
MYEPVVSGASVVTTAPFFRHVDVADCWKLKKRTQTINLHWDYVHTKFYPNPFSCSGVESCRQPDRLCAIISRGARTERLSTKITPEKYFLSIL